MHDLRRAAARRLVQAGVPTHLAMRVLGHKTESIFKRYAITMTADIVDAVRRVAEARKTAKA